MKPSKKDIEEFLKESKEKPITYKNGKRITPTSDGDIVEKIKKKRR